MSSWGAARASPASHARQELNIPDEIHYPTAQMSDLSQQTQPIQHYLRKHAKDHSPWFSGVLSLSLSVSPMYPQQTLCIFLCKWRVLFFTRQDASSRAQHGMITDSRWGKQQGQKDETSCPRTVASVHLANTNWHWQEELPVGKKTKQNIHLLAFEIIMNAIY